ESALVFGSGYSANLGTLSAFAMRDLTVIYDELSHASIRDGMRLGKSTTWKFKHNDLKDLEEKIKKAATPVLVVTESVFSMDGDSPDFDRLLELKKLYKFALFVDEAHGFGWVESGQTRTEQLGIAEHIEARTVTFGKALGAHGAAVLCSENWKAFLVNFARPFIYSTGPSSSFYHRIGEQYLKIKGADEERKSLSSNMAYFLSRKKKSSLKMIVSASPIQGVIGNEVQVRGWEQKLLENGVSAKKILSPTVATGKERIRICLHSFNTKEEIDLLFNLLEDESH
ncbi:MAG: aminotransferase class I/II-fold pyridoxal phosphate-dependent enzyme, partial [Flavobacteriales bacterium]